MIVSARIVADAKFWGIKELESHADTAERFTRPDDVVDLMANATSEGAERGARMLLRTMAEGPWKVIRGAHYSSDPNLHVLIEVGGQRYHLKLDGNSCVGDITHRVNGQVVRISGHFPWAGPGA